MNLCKNYFKVGFFTIGNLLLFLEAGSSKGRGRWHRASFDKLRTSSA
jgi:hypothetical protein